MPRKSAAAAIVGTFCTLACCGTATLAADSLQRHEYAQVHMGATFKLVLYAPDRELANKAAQAAFDRIAQLDERLSDYQPQSELNRLCRRRPAGEAVAVSEDLFRVLTRGQQLARASQGAFDPTIGPVVRLWRRARRNKQMPSPQRLAAARQAVGYDKLQLDGRRRTVRLTHEGMQLDLGGIAKGFAADEALAVLRKQGLDRALVDAGGDVSVGSPPPGAKGWRIGIAPLDENEQQPSEFLLLANCSVATSGDSAQHVVIDGVRYSHIVDPHTGLGLTDHSSVTVVAPDGATADALASAVSVLGPKRGLRLVEDQCGVEARIVRQAEGTRELTLSKGFDALRAAQGGR